MNSKTFGLLGRLFLVFCVTLLLTIWIDAEIAAIILRGFIPIAVLTLYAKIWIICDEIHEYLERKEEEEEEDC